MEFLVFKELLGVKTNDDSIVFFMGLVGETVGVLEGSFVGYYFRVIYGKIYVVGEVCGGRELAGFGGVGGVRV